MSHSSVSCHMVFYNYVTIILCCDFTTFMPALTHPLAVCVCSDIGRTLAAGSNGQAETPDCGACAAGFSPFDASYFNGSASGMR